MTTPVLQDYNQSILSSIKNFNYQIDPPKNLYGVLECLFKQTDIEKIYGDLGIKLSNFIKKDTMSKESISKLADYCELAREVVKEKTDNEHDKN